MQIDRLTRKSKSQWIVVSTPIDALPSSGDSTSFTKLIILHMNPTY